MKGRTLRYNRMALEHACSEATSRLTHNQPVYEEESVGCPDCFDAMIRFYDWDSVRYLCENCGLTIANPVIHFSTSITEEQESE